MSCVHCSVWALIRVSLAFLQLLVMVGQGKVLTTFDDERTMLPYTRKCCPYIRHIQYGRKSDSAMTHTQFLGPVVAKKDGQSKAIHARHVSWSRFPRTGMERSAFTLWNGSALSCFSGLSLFWTAFQAVLAFFPKFSCFSTLVATLVERQPKTSWTGMERNAFLSHSFHVFWKMLSFLSYV